MDIKLYQGADIAPYIGDLARLRIEVFRSFPYLYDGSVEYEEKYLQTYAASPESLFVLALDGDKVVGVSTGIPMSDETDAVKAPFIAHGWDPERVFYFGESVLKSEYRGKGLGVRFFEERETYARRLCRFDWCAFCAVQRPDDHPMRPADYQPLDSFWANRGYRQYPQLATTFTWKDVGEPAETPKPMSFWMKEIA